MGCGSTTVKYLLFLFNLICALGGLALLVTGTMIKLNLGKYEETLKGSVSVSAILLIAVGAFIFIVAFFGCCGAIQESICMLNTYVIIMSILLIIQVIGGILILTGTSGDITNDAAIKEAFQKSFNDYSTNADSKRFWDEIQKDGYCCGIDGPSDWLKQVSVPPASCRCAENAGDACNIAGIYKQGCFEKLKQILGPLGTSLGVVALCVAFLELMTAIFACCLISSFKRKRMSV